MRSAVSTVTTPTMTIRQTASWIKYLPDELGYLFRSLLYISLYAPDFTFPSRVSGCLSTSCCAYRAPDLKIIWTRSTKPDYSMKMTAVIWFEPTDMRSHMTNSER